jgi:hypothetical protein
LRTVETGAVTIARESVRSRKPVGTTTYAEERIEATTATKTPNERESKSEQIRAALKR